MKYLAALIFTLVIIISFLKPISYAANENCTLTAGFWVEDGMVEFLKKTYNVDFDQWAEKQITRWNKVIADSGVNECYKLAPVRHVPNNSLPLNGGVRTNNPDKNDLSVDVQWGFPIWDLENNKEKTQEFWERVMKEDNGIDFGLLHELSHARYLTDDYCSNTFADQVKVKDPYGNPVIGTEILSDPNGLVYITKSHDLMEGHWDKIARQKYSLRNTLALNARIGHVADKYFNNQVIGNWNMPADGSIYLSYLPKENYLRILDRNQKPINNAGIKIFQSKYVLATKERSCNNLNKEIDESPDITNLFTDSNGLVNIGNNPFGDSGLNLKDRKILTNTNSILLLEVYYNEQLYYQIIESYDFNLAYLQGHTDSQIYNIITNLSASTTAPNVNMFSNISANLSKDNATFNFVASGPKQKYLIDLSTDKNMSKDVYLNFATGIDNPITENNPTKWEKYVCGQTLYWKIFDAYKKNSSPIQTVKVCENEPASTFTPTPSLTFTPTPTLTPTLTVTPTLTLTPTPIPTIQNPNLVTCASSSREVAFSCFTGSSCPSDWIPSVNNPNTDCGEGYTCCWTKATTLPTSTPTPIEKNDNSGKIDSNADGLGGCCDNNNGCKYGEYCANNNNGACKSSKSCEKSNETPSSTETPTPTQPEPKKELVKITANGQVLCESKEECQNPQREIELERTGDNFLVNIEFFYSAGNPNEITKTTETLVFVTPEAPACNPNDESGWEELDPECIEGQKGMVHEVYKDCNGDYHYKNPHFQTGACGDDSNMDSRIGSDTDGIGGCCDNNDGCPQDEYCANNDNGACKSNKSCEKSTVESSATCSDGTKKVGDTWPQCEGCDEGVMTCIGQDNYSFKVDEYDSTNCGSGCGKIDSNADGLGGCCSDDSGCPEGEYCADNNNGACKSNKSCEKDPNYNPNLPCDNGHDYNDHWPECRECDEGTVTCLGGNNYKFDVETENSANCGSGCGVDQLNEKCEDVYYNDDNIEKCIHKWSPNDPYPNCYYAYDWVGPSHQSPCPE